MKDDFPTLLRSYRERISKSRNALAHEVGCDPSYCTRIEHGDREPPSRHIVEAFSRGLRLTIPERNRLLVAAGYVPSSFMQLDGWDDCFQSVCDVLTDIHLSVEERDEFRSVVRLISARWRGGAELTPRFAS